MPTARTVKPKSETPALKGPDYAQPILRWAGNKRWLAPLVVPRAVAAIGPNGRFIEPFAGSAAMSFAIGSVRSVRLEIADICAPLIEFYRDLRVAPTALWEHYRLLRQYHRLGKGADKNEAAVGYFSLRARFNHQPSGLIRSAAFLLLNQTCFNGLCRLNAQSGFNVPFGHRRSNLEEADFARAAIKLAPAFLHCGRWGGILSMLQPGAGDVIYADPPYTGTFDGYSGDEWTADDDMTLADQLAQFARYGAKVFVSQGDTPHAREAYKAFDVEEVTPPKGHVIGGKGDRRKDGKELLFVSR